MSLVQMAVLFAGALSFGHAARSLPEIPDFLRVCRRSDPQLNECIRRSVDALRHHLRVGIPELLIPACEPLSVPEIELSQAAGPITLRSIYRNIKIWGATDFVLKSIKLDIENNRIKVKLNLPRLEMRSQYSMEGKILMLPIIGQGLALGNYSDIDVRVRMQGERYRERRTGALHFRVLDFNCNFDVGHARIHLDNLFNGDETLADAMNLFLNDNWRTVAAEIKPALEDTMSRLFKSFSNKIFSKYPIDALLPP